MIAEELQVVGRIAVGGTVRGRNRYTDELVAGVVISLTRSILVPREVTATVEQPRPQPGYQSIAYIRTDDLQPDNGRCRRPVTIPDPKHTGGQPQGTGYRCANCGRTIWFIRDGSAEGGERMTHDAALSVRQGF